MSRSSTNNAKNIQDSGGNRWKRHLHSLRLSLSRKRHKNVEDSDGVEEQCSSPECSLGQHQMRGSGVADVSFDNRCKSSLPNSRRRSYGGKSSPSNVNCSSKDVTVLDYPTASNDKGTVKKRKGFSRQTKDGTVRDNKNRSTSQRNLPNGENISVHRPNKPQDNVKRRRNRFGKKNAKSMLIFPSWLRSLGRSSAAKNSKHVARGLSVSTGNFNEQERNFKLLTDVRLLRDPGYISSSADSLDRENEGLYEDKYQSLRRSRASLIDIRWHKHGHSEGNLISPKDNLSKNKSSTHETSCKNPSSPNVSAFQSPCQKRQASEVLLNNNYDKGAGISKRDSSKGLQRRRENKHCTSKCAKILNSAVETSPESTCKNYDLRKTESDADLLESKLQFDENRQEKSCNTRSNSNEKHTEEEDVYLTAEEDQGESKLSKQSELGRVKFRKKACSDTSEGKMLSKNAPCDMVLVCHVTDHESNCSRKERSVSWTHLPVAVVTDTSGNVKWLDKSEEVNFLHTNQSKEVINNLQRPCLSKVPKNLSRSQPLKTLPSCPGEVLVSHLNADITTSVSTTMLDKDTGNVTGCVQNVCKKCQAHASGAAVRNSQRNLYKLSFAHHNEYHDHHSPCTYCPYCMSSTRLNSPTELYHDIVFTRRPKKPAPKPPSPMKNRSQSLTALSGKYPSLSEQLAINETSSVHKLNDSCGENLCELISQSKDKLHTSEGVYVGILGDQGVILRKKRVLPNPKRVLSMPAELLGNVIVEVEVTETSNQSSNDGSTSEISSEHTSPLQSSEGEVYLSCNSNSPSPITSCTSSVEKECCRRLLSISSIDVQELSVERKVHSQSVPSLVLKKDCVHNLKSMQGDYSVNRTFELSSENGVVESLPLDCCSNSSRTQSMVSLNQKGIVVGDGDTNEKVSGKPLMYAEALWDHVTMNEEELCFTAGQAIAVYNVEDPEWWFGLVEDHIGWFPASFVRIPVSGDLWDKYQNCVGKKLKGENGDKQFDGSRNYSSVCPSKEEVRCKILEEIVNTEQDYVQNLKDIVEGYLKQARKRRDMFSDKLLETIFSNIENIYQFHMDFLCCIRSQCSPDIQCVSKVGEAFLKNKQKFSLYSEYCNNHPRASFELKTLLQQDKYRYFFEACRLLQEMIRISLDGFLLAPVQKICKYPLQLQELLKYTDPEHDDYDNVKKALETMREVASSINEKKRKVENIQKIAEWQLGIEQWQGEDVLIKSSQLVHSGEVIKISKGRSQEVTLFLFDHQLVFCRKMCAAKVSVTMTGQRRIRRIRRITGEG